MKTKAIKSVSILCALALLAAPAVSAAVTVYLNGVDISTVRDRTFKNATVHVDKNGDVHITADGYKVEVVDEEDAPSSAGQAGNVEAGANPALSARYFLATTPSPNGRAQYDLVLEINGVERKIIKAGTPSVIMEISSWMQKGENKIKVTAKKRIQGARASDSKKDEVRLLLGAGHEDNNVVKMDVVEIDFKCNASQLGDISRRYTVNAI